MKKLIIAILISSFASYGFAQREAIGASIFTGYSGVAAFKTTSNLEKWVKNNYGTFHQIFLIFGTTEPPPTDYSHEVKLPIGARIWFNTSQRFSIGFEYNSGRVLAEARLQNEPIVIQRDNQMRTLTGLLICHPNPRLIKDYGLDFYIVTGLGKIRYELKHQVYCNEELEDNQLTETSEWIPKFGAGLAYFPAKRIGVQIELGTGITNAQLGLVFKTK